MAPLQDQALSSGWEEPRATALLVLANGMVFEGVGIGATGESTKSKDSQAALAASRRACIWL